MWQANFISDKNQSQVISVIGYREDDLRRVLDHEGACVTITHIVIPTGFVCLVCANSLEEFEQAVEDVAHDLEIDVSRVVHDENPTPDIGM